jgi:hypothetical protein
LSITTLALRPIRHVSPWLFTKFIPSNIQWLLSVHPLLAILLLNETWGGRKGQSDSSPIYEDAGTSARSDRDIRQSITTFAVEEEWIAENF